MFNYNIGERNERKRKLIKHKLLMITLVNPLEENGSNGYVQFLER